MNAKKVLALCALVVIVALSVNLTLFIKRQVPRPIPATPAETRSVAWDILHAKCVDCHDSRRGLPFYAHVPGPGSLIRKDIVSGLRHWDVYDVGHLGPTANQSEKEGAEIPLGRLIKLRQTVAANTMPPLQYTALHWGTSLTASENTILTNWVNQVWGTWLAQWGITTGIENDIQPIPDSIPYDTAKAALGEKLYHDPRFSLDNTIACVSCHAFDKGGTDNLPFSIGVDGLKGGVNAPTVFNAFFNMRQFWDGRARDLAEQAAGPPLNPVEMASKTWEEIIVKFEADDALKKELEALYPEGITAETLCDAIGEYELRLITPNARFDRFLKGDKEALQQNEQRGYHLFDSLQCAACHAGPGMGGLSFEYVDLKADPFIQRARTDDDAGLAAFSLNPADTGRLKVPLLRNIALTAPYLHDASEPELRGAVEFMLKHQVGVTLQSQEIEDLTAFLHTLTGELFGKAL